MRLDKDAYDNIKLRVKMVLTDKVLGGKWVKRMEEPGGKVSFLKASINF